MNIIALGFLGSLAAGLMTAAGAAPILFGRTVSRRTNDVLLGFAAGVMLSASFFSLIIPSLEISTRLYGEGYYPVLIAVGGIILGAAAIHLLDERIPHRHFIKGYPLRQAAGPAGFAGSSPRGCCHNPSGWHRRRGQGCGSHGAWRHSASSLTEASRNPA